MRGILICAVFVASALPTQAADLVPQSEPAPSSIVARAFDWTGVEFGALGGGDWLRADGSMFANPPENFRGGRLGFFGGYQYQFNNNIVLGLEGDASYTWNERDDFLYLGLPEKIRTDWSATARARVGYAFDNLLLYATGGWATTRAVDSVQGFDSQTETFNGYTIGAGVDYAFTDKLFARAEYRYNAFGDKRLSNGLDVDLSQHVASIGIGAKF